MQRKQLKNAKITLSILFTLMGITLIFYSYFAGIKSNLFNYKNIKLMEQRVLITEALQELSDADLSNIYVDPEDMVGTGGIDDYIGYLEVPDVGIKRGFVSLNSKYNSVGYNVMLIEGSTMPDVKNGNLILAAHRGTSAVSFFENLYKLNTGALAYVYYQGKTYKYKLTNIYYEAKDGNLTITRNAEASVLTLITCTRSDKTTQTVFIFEQVSVD